jgi:uncharacterized NAD(P)/FAD-binding protein YdhS
VSRPFFVTYPLKVYMIRVAIIGSGPTGIYTLQGLIASTQPLSITVFEETPDAGKGTPYHPAVNDRAMLANIASIELPPINQSLVEWLRSKSDAELEALDVAREAIGDREFYPRVVLGDYFADQFWALVKRGIAGGHTIDVKASHKIRDIILGNADVALKYTRRGGEDGDATFDHVVMATGHDWPDDTEVSPGYFSSPWPASAIKRIGPVEVGVLGTSLSGIDAVVSVATAHGMFLRDQNGTLGYQPARGTERFRITMMSRKGLLPEADFYCPMPYEPLVFCTKDAVERLISDKPDRLLDEIFDLFKQEILLADPDYAAKIGLGLATLEDIAGRYFREREEADPFVWAATNLSEAKANKMTRTTVQWRYAILRMHEVIALAVPHFNESDLKRFHQHFKAIFVDDYATVPHQSVERLLALHNSHKLQVRALGEDHDIQHDSEETGAVVTRGSETMRFAAFIDATGQHALSASDLPFPSLRRSDVLKDAKTRTGDLGGRLSSRRTGGIDIDDDFRPRVEPSLTNHLYCVSLPFLLHKLPFVQGITSSHEMGTRVAQAIVSSAGRDSRLFQFGEYEEATITSSSSETVPSHVTPE